MIQEIGNLFRRTVSEIMLALLLTGILISISSGVNAYVNVDTSQAKQMIDSNPDLVILDVRAQSEYDTGHIQDATLIPLSELSGRLGELNKDKEILVYCATGGRSATASQTLVDNGFSKVYNMLGGIAAWKNAGYWIEIVHNGDLTIDGTQTFVIENCTFIQTGNIYVKDYAKLVVQNATLLMNQTEAFQSNIRVTVSGVLEVKNSNITSQTNFGIYLNDFSQAKISLATISAGGLGVGSFEVSEYSEMEIDNSIIYLIIGYGGSISIHNSIVGEIVALVLCTVDIHNSTVTIRLGVTGGATVAAYNCTIAQPWLAFSAYGTYFYSKANLQNLNPGFYQFWKITLNATVEGTGFDLTFQNVWITEGWLVEAMTTNILELRLKVIVSNSTIGLDLLTDPDVSIYNSTIYLLHMNTFVGTLFLNATVITSIIVQGAQCHIHGNATFPKDTTIYWFPSSTLPPRYPNNSILRDYNIITRGINGDVMGNATLTLFDKNNVLVWNGTTNSLGQANFNLTFTDSNYTDTLRLEADKGNLSAPTTDISFLSSTPVTLTMAAHDIAVAGVSPSKTVPGQGYYVDINVTVANLGDLSETFYVTTYANATNMGTYEVLNLANGTSRNSIFPWNTADLGYGNYTTSVCAQPVLGEMETSNNNCTVGWILVTIPGDIDGNFNVALADLVTLARAYGSKPGDSNWNPNADIDGNGAVGLSDLVALAQHYGQHYP